MSYYTANQALYWDGSHLTSAYTGRRALNAGDVVPDGEVTRDGLDTAGLVTLQSGGVPSRSGADVLEVWTANRAYLAGQEILDPTGVTILVRQSTGTSRTTYDSTEQALWSAAGAGGGGGGSAVTLTPTAVKTANYTAAVGDLVPVDTTSASRTVTLPTAPADKSQVGVKHVVRGGTNTVTIACGGSDVFNKAGGSTSATLTLLNQGAVLQYKASGAIWYVVSDDLALSQLDLRYQTPLGALNVKDYGAKGDGTTDDTAAIQAALDAAAATVTSSQQTVNGTLIYVGPGTGGGKVHLPPGTYLVSASLQVKNLTRLEGVGWASTLLAAPTLNGPVVLASGPRMWGTQLASFRIDGNRANQSGSGSIGVQWQSHGGFTAYVSGDAHKVGANADVMENLFIVNTKGHGVILDNSVSGLWMHNCHIANVGGIGISCGVMFDSDIVQCEVQGSDRAGMYFPPSSAVIRVTNCKVYGAGVLGNESAYFIEGSELTFTNCEAEENRGNSWELTNNATNNIIGHCRSEGGNAYGLLLAGNNNNIELFVESGWGYTTTAAAHIAAGATGNSVRVQTPLAVAVTSGSAVAGNTVSVNNDRGLQSLAYASTLSVDPYAGGTVKVGTLTGNVSLTTSRAHAGAKLRFLFTQDATGGRTITFSNTFLTNWTPSTAANAVNAISFEYDGANWVQTGASVGLAPPGALLTDGFGRSISSTSLGVADSGQTWTAQGTSVWGLDGSGHAYCSTQNSGGQSFATVDVGTGNVDLTCVISNVVFAEFSGMTLRWGDANNQILVQIDSGILYLTKVVAGSATTLGSYAAGLTNNTGHTLRCVVNGSNYAVYLDGTQRITASDSALSTNTKVGLRVAGGSGSATRFDSISCLAA